MYSKIPDLNVSNEYGAFWYVWNHSKEIRHWYLTQAEERFDPHKEVSPSNYRTFGMGAPGDLVSEIIADGERSGIIHLNEEAGEYEGVSDVVCPKCRSDDVIKSGTVARRGGKVQTRTCNYCGYKGTAGRFSI